MHRDRNTCTLSEVEVVSLGLRVLYPFEWEAA